MVRQRSTPSHSGNPKSASRYADIGRKPGGNKAAFSEVLGGMLGPALDRIIDNGDAVMISRTSDGGAISIVIYDGSAKPTKLYSVQQEELDEYIGKLSE